MEHVDLIIQCESDYYNQGPDLFEKTLSYHLKDSKQSIHSVLTTLDKSQRSNYLNKLLFQYEKHIDWLYQRFPTDSDNYPILEKNVKDLLAYINSLIHQENGNSIHSNGTQTPTIDLEESKKKAHEALEIIAEDVVHLFDGFKVKLINGKIPRGNKAKIANVWQAFEKAEIIPELHRAEKEKLFHQIFQVSISGKTLDTVSDWNLMNMLTDKIKSLL